MRINKTLLFAILVFVFSLGVYYFEYKKNQEDEVRKEMTSQFIKFPLDQIKIIEVLKKNEKISLFKSEDGWMILEPIQDKADNDQIIKMIEQMAEQKWIAVAKEAAQIQDIDLTEYGLDHPLAVFNIKNNLGQSIKISVGTQKNFEGHSYLKIDSENKIYVGQSIWFSYAENQLIFYRDKRLYRDPIANINAIKIKSLSETLSLNRVNGQWMSSDFALDQNKVREIIKKITQSMISEYVFDGEPSRSILEDKGLIGENVLKVELNTAESNWNVSLGSSEKENGVFALTDRPTRLIKMEPDIWETIGNLNIDSLRDRISITRFSMDQVRKLYFKFNGIEMNFQKENETWSPSQKLPEGFKFDEVEFNRALKRLHEIEVSEFIDKKMESQFSGKEMVVLKAENGHLIYQLNWGPELKINKNGIDRTYYYARTQIASSIFAIDKKIIDNLGFTKSISKLSEENKE